MKQIKVSDEVYARLLEYADRRPLGIAVERLLDTIDSVRHATEQVREGKTLTHKEVFGDPPPVETSPAAEPSLDPDNPPELGILQIGPPGSARPKPLCTCPPAEMRKGKHNKHCPARGA